ncbi:MAG: glycine cleavage system protein H [Acidithiobacillus ferrooxidans]|uniref:Glycine cleavage system H protein 3 n=1 Tax=mine drainage metagenome TaxID=410659 RepID=E6QFW5_9ZZZZ|nr:glycine cleavage system protein H [Acidithiobacillus ferrooxidans]MBU2858257.1 glycine cleavage system protein H [Acidithiobacillus ferrooxidans]MBU2861085.1 glycine cleavage system protein H [Acidithiobacillus ferrooxidans]MCL4527629.1 glycine cleavage system protein H [Gammaproteobacteria bacterium]
MSEFQGCQLPEDLHYDLDYVWARPEEDGTFTIGVTDPAQTMSGRLQKARIKKVGTHLEAGRHVATLESGKWAGGVPVPFAGSVIARNDTLLENPHLINIDPYGDAWIARVRPDDPATALERLHTGPDAVAALQAWIKRYDVQCMRCSD